jgi:hypothetical protein
MVVAAASAWHVARGSTHEELVLAGGRYQWMRQLSVRTDEEPGTARAEGITP